MDNLILIIAGVLPAIIAIIVLVPAIKKSISENSKENLQRSLDEFIRLEKSFKDEMVRNREELSGGLNRFQSQLNELGKIGREENSRALGAMTETLDKKLTGIMEQNSKKLDEMRATVDEKLQKTLNDRLSESFKQVSANLEAVNRGLGEMKGLANGVGDLKKVLSNVKTRGILGEIQLGNILEQILSPTQYEKNVCTKQGSRDPVEFAIKLPGKDQDEKPVWQAVDSKFPLEPYERLLAAYDVGQIDLIKEAQKELENAIKKSAKDIRDKYVDPPNTTDFGILFLPVEGLYAEVVRHPALIETLMRDMRVVVTGPSTLAALLSSLQMGFQTLAFEQRSQEIRQILGAVKKEFSTFGDVLERVRGKIQGAGVELDTLVGTRTRQIQRSLRGVEELPADKAKLLLGSVTVDIEDDTP